MFIKRFKTIGGLSYLNRYTNMLAGVPSYIPTTNSTAIVLNLAASPYMAVWNWFNGTTTGFNGKYANPATPPPYIVTGSSWSRGKGYLAIAFAFSPRLIVYPFNDAVGFGTKYSDPTTIAGGYGNAVHLDVDSGVISLNHETSPYISVYPFSTVGGFGVKYANPSSLPSFGGGGIKYFGNTIAASQGDHTPFINAYSFTTTSGFGTKYADPSNLPTYSGYGLDASPSGQTIISGGISGVLAYPWSETSGFGTKYAQPAGNPYSFSGKFSSSGNSIMTVSYYSSSGAHLHVYPFSTSTGFGTKYANPATSTIESTSSPNSVTSTYGDTAIAYATTASPWVYAYAFSESSGFGAKYSDPPVIYTGSGSYGGINFN